MVRLLFLVVIAFTVFVLLRGLLAKRNLNVQQFFAIYFATLVGIALLYLGVTGRLHPLFAVVGAVLPFLFRLVGVITHGARIAAILRMLKARIPGAGRHRGPDQSEIRTDFIHMVLDHDTGVMDGTVLRGSCEGLKLSNMTLDQLKNLLQEAAVDEDSVNLLVAYLDREHPEWQQGNEESQQRSQRPPPHDGGMHESEALDILGLEPGATHDDIVSAHKRLIQKLHPDRGGSTYLATKINAAKDFLLERAA